jgi:hypothetical protein
MPFDLCEYLLQKFPVVPEQACAVFADTVQVTVPVAIPKVRAVTFYYGDRKGSIENGFARTATGQPLTGIPVTIFATTVGDGEQFTFLPDGEQQCSLASIEFSLGFDLLSSLYVLGIGQQ